MTVLVKEAGLVPVATGVVDDSGARVMAAATLLVNEVTGKMATGAVSAGHSSAPVSVDRKSVV